MHFVRTLHSQIFVGVSTLYSRNMQKNVHISVRMKAAVITVSDFQQYIL
jgi:hypothetical protein